ncbi:T9SS type A sorting domain-containing protein [candidate division WOR-3 bacterium]|nr:T9SS type A sorting domain-containing protein [candidate division WOR-3 bacterium]
MSKDSCFWTTLSASRITFSVTRTSMPIDTCMPYSQAVCYGTDLGIVPGPSTQVAERVEPEPGNLRVVPNPVCGRAQVSYTMAQPGRVSLKLYDISGKVVSTLRSGSARAGEYRQRLSSAGLASGVYLLRLETEAGTTTRKVTIE